MLTGEFDNLFSSLFSNPDKHTEVIRGLAKKNKGLSREEVASVSKTESGGALSAVLDELSESGFILKTRPFGKKEKDSLYRLSDEFTLFYLRFMDRPRGGIAAAGFSGAWDGNSFASWSGYAF